MSRTPLALSARHAVDRVDAAASVDPIDVADYLLGLLLRQSILSAWFDPRPGGRHDITLEPPGGPPRRLALVGGMGDAVLARLALLAGLDLIQTESQAGTARVRDGEQLTEVVVAIRPTASGLAGEVRLFEEHATPISSGAGTAAPEGPGRQLPEVFAAGTEIGAYRVLRALGRGGMGVVYEVEHIILGKRFAMKVLFAWVLARDPVSARRFVREARAAARVRHPGIVAVSDFGTLPDARPYIVMELLEGRTLHGLSVHEGPLEPVRAVRLLGQVARALRAAHDQGVVHRDLTLANIFVQPGETGERVVLVDFGSATSPDPEQIPDGPPGTVVGTPHYMSPEQIRGRATDVRSDLYSLGVILHELLTGTPPYDGDTPREIALGHLNRPIPELTSEHQELPPELGDLHARLLAKSPAERPSSAAELITLLDRIETTLSRRGWRRWLPG